MKKMKCFALLLAVLLLAGCGANGNTGEKTGVAATTGPVAQFAAAIVDGTGLTVTQVIADSVSCLHDYSLSVGQMETIERSRVVLVSGAGLEDFMEDALAAAEQIVDCSRGIELQQNDEGDDPHIWLDPDRAAQMAENICAGLSDVYPEHQEIFQANLEGLLQRFSDLKAYGEAELADAVSAYVEEGKMDADMAACIRHGDILGFLNGGAGRRMKAAARAGTLWREQPFVLGVDAREMYPEEQEGELILVQGIIDAYFEESDGLVVLDYKTDQIYTPEGLIERYHSQLDYYAKALEQLTQKKVKEKIIYSFTIKKEIRLP